MARTPRGSILHRPSPGEAGRRGGLFQFFGEVISELRKVTWPTRQETTRLTVIVILISGAIGLALGLIIDPAFTRIFKEIFF